jgi:hypothetical protein
MVETLETSAYWEDSFNVQELGSSISTVIRLHVGWMGFDSRQGQEIFLLALYPDWLWANPTYQMGTKVKTSVCEHTNLHAHLTGDWNQNTLNENLFVLSWDHQFPMFWLYLWPLTIEFYQAVSRYRKDTSCHYETQRLDDEGRPHCS